MVGNYRGTSVDFTYETLEQFRKEVLASPHLGETGFGETNLREFAMRYGEICTRLERAIWRYGAAHRGPDSTAAQDRLKELVRLGNEGVEKLWTMAAAMAQQTPAFKQMHDQLVPLATMEHGVWDGFSEPAGPIGMAATAIPLVGPLARYGEPAVEAGVGIWERYQAENLAGEYQAATNQSLETAIPVFEPPRAQQFGTGQDPVLTTTGSGGGAVGTTAPGAGNAGLAPAQAPLPPEVPGASGGAGNVNPAAVGETAPGGIASLAPGRQAASVAPLAPAADLSRNAHGGDSRATSGPAVTSGSTARKSLYPNSSGPLSRVDGLGSRGLPAGGVIRPQAPRGAVPADEPASPRPRPNGTIVAENQARPGIPRGNTSTATPQPMVPTTGMGASQGGGSRRRPDWLIEPDPDSYWLADVPPHLPAVLGPTDTDDLDD